MFSTAPYCSLQTWSLGIKAVAPKRRQQRPSTTRCTSPYPVVPRVSRIFVSYLYCGLHDVRIPQHAIPVRC